MIALMILIILGVCCCFMRIDPTTPPIYEIETERRRIKEVSEAGFTDIELNNGRRDDDAFDNIAFEIGKPHYTMLQKLSKCEVRA